MTNDKTPSRMPSIISKSPLPSALETVILLPFNIEKSTGKFILTGTDAYAITPIIR